MKKTLSVIGASLLAFTTLVSPSHATEFKPGDRGFGVEVPADTRLADTGQPHPCAGRKLAYHSHVDAIYATRLDGELQTMIVDGQVPIPANELCLRLAPDANKRGEEVSRMVVPYDDPKLSFLGEPGTILWVAPQLVDFMDSWRPLWAGAGAFDSHHELEVPTDFQDNKITMELADVDGPGDVEMFFYNRAVDEPVRTFSTRENIKTFDLNVGSHGHYSWTFSQAGIYHLTWQVHGTKTDGTQESGPLVTTTWLVGSDEEVGLPEGSTTELAPIKKSAEVIRDEMRAAFSPDPTTSIQPPAEVYTQSKEQVEKLLWRSNPTALITHGHQDMGLFGSGLQATAKMHSDVDGDHRSTSFVYAVPNSALTQIPGQVSTSLGVCAGWVLPQSQDPQLPWPGFSTENFDYSSITSEGLTLSIAGFEGPGRMIASHDSLTSTTISLDSADLGLKVHYPERSHDHMAFTFTEPGAYRVVYAFEGTTTEGKPVYKELVAYYMVGNSALYDAATQMGIDPSSLQFAEPAERDTTPACLPEVEEPEPTTPAEVPPTTTSTKSPSTDLPPHTTKPTTNSSHTNVEYLGLAMGVGVVALKFATHFLHKERSDQSAKSNESAAQPPAAKTVKRPDMENDPVAQPVPSIHGEGNRTAASGGQKPLGSSGATGSSPRSAAKASDTKSSTAKASTTPKPAPAKPMPARHAAPVQQNSPTQAQAPQVTNAAASGGFTAGGWVAGFVVGIGIMALLGGLGLFLTTIRTLRKFGGHSPEDQL